VGDKDARVAPSPEDVPLSVDDGSPSEETSALPSPIPGSPVARRATAVATPETSVSSSLSAKSAGMFTQESSTGEGRAGMETPTRHLYRLKGMSPCLF
jgi:hypothetical protein